MAGYYLLSNEQGAMQLEAFVVSPLGRSPIPARQRTTIGGNEDVWSWLGAFTGIGVILAGFR